MTENKNEKSCKNCRYNYTPENSSILICNRYPQQMETFNYYWCGEWKDKKDKKLYIKTPWGPEEVINDIGVDSYVDNVIPPTPEPSEGKPLKEGKD